MNGDQRVRGLLDKNWKALHPSRWVMPEALKKIYERGTATYNFELCSDLLRFMRNCIEHYEATAGRKVSAADAWASIWAQFTLTFPKFVPLLYDVVMQSGGSWRVAADGTIQIIQKE